VDGAALAVAHVPGRLGVPLHARDIRDAELRGQVLDHDPRHVRRIVREEPADVAHRAHLASDPEPTVVPTPLRDQLAVLVIQKKNRSSSGLVGSLATAGTGGARRVGPELSGGRRRSWR
jgi:hypothetical protein